MNLTIFQPLINEQRHQQEQQNIQWDLAPPEVGSLITTGGDRRWQVFAVEEYKSENCSVYLAHIHPEGEPLPVPTVGTIQALRQFSPYLSFYIHVAPDDSFLGHGWRMNGDAPIGQLLTHGGSGVETEDGIKFENVYLPWVVDLIDTYKPVGEASYTTIHLCHCLPVALPEMAVA
ncbi:hypothetical protein [Stenomitos frigidus]|uniref:Uncharacterized protein n=1 Tax=Stenomitos frigidus ULC18 TaxID=2107698 RepID=A0A2T1EAV8_9CYAN|nr:hypothetical protein [Stenomitos frigidus]PSB29889.1 hypothetical protein C7B82_10070 [Stenomitos frigidus ULC18]